MTTPARTRVQARSIRNHTQLSYDNHNQLLQRDVHSQEGSRIEGDILSQIDSETCFSLILVITVAPLTCSMRALLAIAVQRVVKPRLVLAICHRVLRRRKGDAKRT